MISAARVTVGVAVLAASGNGGIAGAAATGGFIATRAIGSGGNVGSAMTVGNTAGDVWLGGSR